MTKLILDALVFSIGDYIAIENWVSKTSGIFEVNMPPGIARAPLTGMIFIPDILLTSTHGVLIADHRRYPDEEITTVVRQLRNQDKYLYSVSHGVEPVGGGSFNLDRESICFADTPILKILKDCQPALRWLNTEGPTQTLPDRYEGSIKRLEKLGIVYRRNNKTISLRHHRLRKVLAHESKKLTAPCKLEDLLLA